MALPGGLGRLIIPLQLLERRPGRPDVLHPEGDFQALAPVCQGQIGFGLFGLLGQGADPAFQFGQNIPQPLQIALGGGEPVLGLGPAVAVFGDAAGVLKDFPPLAALGRHNFGDLPLADDGIAVPADAGIQQQFVDILQPADLAIDGVFAVARPVIPPADHHFFGFQVQGVVGIVQRQTDRGIAHGPPPPGPAEDHIFHLAGAAQLAAAGLSQHPPDGVGQVAFA